MAKEKDTTVDVVVETTPEPTTEETPDLAAGAIAALQGSGEGESTTEETPSVVDALMKAMNDGFASLIKRMEDHEKSVDAKVNGLGTSFSKAMTDFGAATRQALVGELSKSAPQRRAEDVVVRNTTATDKKPVANDKPRVAPGGPNV